jgi:ABC-type branched-subunit amino acid transport system substrate-binding protein/predicted negative regulator of RcsB-dependent stress response
MADAPPMSNPPTLKHAASLLLFATVFTPVNVGEIAFAQTERTSPQSERAAQIMVEQAQALVETRQYATAVDALKAFLAAYPHSRYVDDAHLLLASAQISNKQATEAIVTLEQLMADYPTSPLIGRARLLMATAHAELGNPDQALATLAEARSLEDSVAIKRDALKLSGDILITKGDYPHAIQSWLDELSLTPDNERPEVRTRIRALIHDKMDRKTLHRLRDTYPTTFPGDLALIRLIELYAAKGEDHQAERNLRIFLNRFPAHEYAQTATETLKSLKGRLKASQYVIVAMIPTSGRHSPFGTEVYNGMKLALEKGKETLGLTSVGLVVIDSETDRGLLRFQLSETIAEYKPLAVIGPLFSRDLPLVAELSEKTETPFLTPTAALADVRRLGTYLFNTSVSFFQQAHRLADYAVQYLGYTRFGILHPDTAYGQELARLFAQEARQFGGEIIAVESYKETDTDFGLPIKRLKNEDLKRHGRTKTVPMSKGGTRVVYEPGFDAVFLPGRSSQIGLLTAQLLFYDVKVGFLGNSTWNSPDLLRAADRTIEGDVFVDGFFADSADPTIHDFVVRYRLRHQTDPTSFAAHAYDATRVVLDAVTKGATSGRAIRDQLMRSPDLPALSGPAAFGSNGMLDRRLFVIEIKKGKFVQVD